MPACFTLACPHTFFLLRDSLPLLPRHWDAAGTSAACTGLGIEAIPGRGSRSATARRPREATQTLTGLRGCGVPRYKYYTSTTALLEELREQQKVISRILDLLRGLLQPRPQLHPCLHRRWRPRLHLPRRRWTARLSTRSAPIPGARLGQRLRPSRMRRRSIPPQW